MLRNRLALLSLIVVLTISVQAQLDQTFGTGGLAKVAAPGNDVPMANFVLPDGKVLAVVTNEFETYHLLRFDSSGAPDTTYGTNGRVTLAIPFTMPEGLRYLESAMRQSDGKIVFVGLDGSDSIIVRVNENGTLDQTFSGDGVDRPNLNPAGQDYLVSVVQQPDGKLVVGAGLSSPQRFSAIKYDINGVLDPTFGAQQGFVYPGEIWSIGMQSTGKVLVFAYHSGVFRLNTNGSMDGAFTVPPDAAAVEFLALANDKFLVTRYEFASDDLNRHDLDMVIRGYNADGSPDTGFGTAGTLKLDVAASMRDELKSIYQQPDGDVVVAAKTYVEVNRTSFKNPHLALVRFDAAGTVKGNYLVTEAEADFGISATQADGKLVVLSTISGTGRDVFLSRLVALPLVKYQFHGIPFQFPAQPGAGPSVHRPSQNKWYVGYNQLDEVIFGTAGDIPVPSDYFADYGSQLSSEIAVFTPSTGTWKILIHGFGPPNVTVSVRWGMNGDIPVPADYDGDGKSDIAVFRPSDGIWYIRNGSDNSFRFEHWGLAGDTPVPGDYDGDGVYDVAVWRPSTGVWYILRSSDRQAEFYHFGMNRDIPIHEDYDGDGTFDIGVWRPTTGMWYIRRSSDGGFTYFNWGSEGDIPVPADYDIDHKTDIAIWRTSTRTWYIAYSSGRPSDPFVFGAAGDMPLAARK